MKKIKIVALGLAALTTLAGVVSCGGTKEYEYALITDVGDIDDESFNQTSWEALEDFAKENGKSYTYYRPTEDKTTAREAAIDQAVQKGAKVVVCPGYLFEDAVYDSQTKYPEVKFVLIDGQPHTSDYATYETASNTVSIIYKEEIAGFFAGYAAAADGNTELGFCGGMAVPAVQRYGSGFVQGINAACEALGTTASVKYYYAGAFAATDEATAKMKSWYTAGMDTVFACGGKVYQSVLEGCKSGDSSATWIGVDVDQASVDTKVLTSATKGLREAVQSALQVYSEGNWSLIGGKDYNLGLDGEFANVEKKDYVGIPTKDSSWRFNKYTIEEFNELVSKIKSGEITISNDTTAAPVVGDKVTVTYESSFC